MDILHRWQKMRCIFTLCVHTKRFLKSFKIFKMWETTHKDKKNSRFNRFPHIVCGVLLCDKDSTPHTNRFSTRFSTMTCVCNGLLCFSLLSARFLIGYCFVSHDNLQIIHAFVLGVPPDSRISDRKYSTCLCWMSEGASDILPSGFSHS